MHRFLVSAQTQIDAAKCLECTHPKGNMDTAVAESFACNC